MSWCVSCSSTMLQWHSQYGTRPDVDVLGRTKGGAIRVKCQKCGKAWRTKAAYATELAAEAKLDRRNTP